MADNLTLKPNVCAVVVTYGNRYDFWSRVVDGCLRNGVWKIVLVDNGASLESKARLETLHGNLPDKCHVIALQENLGSAAGYKAGLQFALNLDGCEFLWLLDDDNVPQDDALRQLLNSYENLSLLYPADRLALLALRKDRNFYKRLTEGEPLTSVYPTRSSFLSVNIVDLPSKLRRCFSKKSKLRKDQLIISVPYGPYGGLFFSQVVTPMDRFPGREVFCIL
ncbi:glycosyltransferase involved in cell wall biosynthesis [Desulfofundulus luciae]|uniref:Glycosyltransferase involved in cell wall biosynthesis n=1 Tax=Desulfofundulus luciae TaxID=74702 RepID=A0ABU0AYJ9_9FIRM|nr:glycosyltransferase [Desulfofundulus luciae]MDQ0285560.1 glycosyltransferase involved in cell wall biosynthesis [Desulfofundulus luciae]